MKRLLLAACCAGLGAISPINLANAHNWPWRDGVSRQTGYGHCAKGPCMKRTCWAPFRPHRHESGQIVTDRYGGPECWRRNARNRGERHP